MKHLPACLPALAGLLLMALPAAQAAQPPTADTNIIVYRLSETFDDLQVIDAQGADQPRAKETRTTRAERSFIVRDTSSGEECVIEYETLPAKSTISGSREKVYHSDHFDFFDYTATPKTRVVHEIKRNQGGGVLGTSAEAFTTSETGATGDYNGLAPQVGSVFQSFCQGPVQNLALGRVQIAGQVVRLVAHTQPRFTGQTFFCQTTDGAAFDKVYECYVEGDTFQKVTTRLSAIVDVALTRQAATQPPEQVGDSQNLQTLEPGTLAFGALQVEKHLRSKGYILPGEIQQAPTSSWFSYGSSMIGLFYGSSWTDSTAVYNESFSWNVAGSGSLRFSESIDEKLVFPTITTLPPPTEGVTPSVESPNPSASETSTPAPDPASI